VAINEIEILAEALDEGEEVEYREERFRIDSLNRLDWAIRKWAGIDREAQQKIDCANRQIERLKAYAKDTQEKADREKSSLEVMMEPFVRQQLEGGKTKTFKAPSGDVQIKKQQPEINRDDETILEFLHENDLNEYIKVVEKPDWAGLKKRLATQVLEDGSVIFMTRDGEVVEGVTGMVRPDKVVVEVR
jgi:phage host-nuclease inhibitor protein Gam